MWIVLEYQFLASLNTLCYRIYFLASLLLNGHQKSYFKTLFLLKKSRASNSETFSKQWVVCFVQKNLNQYFIYKLILMVIGLKFLSGHFLIMFEKSFKKIIFRFFYPINSQKNFWSVIDVLSHLILIIILAKTMVFYFSLYLKEMIFLEQLLHYAT